jgi:hypothetical protein
MPRNSDIKEIKMHIDVINSEIGSIKEDIASIKTNWIWLKWIVCANVTLWVLVLGVVLKAGGA